MLSINRRHLDIYNARGMAIISLKTREIWSLSSENCENEIKNAIFPFTIYFTNTGLFRLGWTNNFDR